jgi:hypothetical protein
VTKPSRDPRRRSPPISPTRIVRAALDRSMGAGAADLLGRVTLNIGVVKGG